MKRSNYLIAGLLLLAFPVYAGELDSFGNALLVAFGGFTITLLVLIVLLWIFRENKNFVIFTILNFLLFFVLNYLIITGSPVLDEFYEGFFQLFMILMVLQLITQIVAIVQAIAHKANHKT